MRINFSHHVVKAVVSIKFDSCMKLTGPDNSLSVLNSSCECKIVSDIFGRGKAQNG